MAVRFRLLVALFTLLLGAAVGTPALAENGRLRVTPTIDPPGETGGQAVPHGSRYKVRDADGNVVAEGGIPGSGGNSGNYQTETIELPPGKYTVEVHYHTPGDRHAEGTRDYRGDREVEIRPGGTSLHQIEVEPRNPEEHLSDRIEGVEDQIGEKEDEIDALKEDIAEHERNGEDVGEEHTDMLDDLEKDLAKLKERRQGMKNKLRKMRGMAAGKKAGAKLGNPAGAVRSNEIPRIPSPKASGGKAPYPKSPKGGYRAR